MSKYKIDERGIYYTENVYHDDVEVHYVVDLEQIDPQSQLDYFIKTIEANGASQRSKEIGRLLGVTK